MDITQDDGFKLLEKVFQILQSEGVLKPKFQDPVILFRDPKDLLVRYVFVCVINFFFI